MIFTVLLDREPWLAREQLGALDLSPPSSHFPVLYPLQLNLPSSPCWLIRKKAPLSFKCSFTRHLSI